MTKRSFLIVGLCVLGLGVAIVGQAATSQFKNNNLRLYGKAFNPVGYFTISDDAVVKGALDVRDSVSNSKGSLTFNDDVVLSSTATINGTTEMKGELFNSNGEINVNDDLNVSGMLSINSIDTPTEATCERSGSLSYDSSYLYVCVEGSWKKAALQDF